MITKKIFDELTKINNQPCVSLYIPMVTAGDYEKNRINFKNACQDALHQLKQQTKDAGTILQSAFDRLDDKNFWANQSPCFAGFYTKDYHKEIQLSNTVHQLVSVHSDFYLSPLTKEISDNKRIFVLAISQNETKFYEAVRDGIYPVRIHDKVVVDMEEALNIDEDDQSLQHHSAGGKAVFHANNAMEDKENVRLKQYLRRIDDGLLEIIHDEQVPLVLAAVEEYHPLYKEVSKYNYVSDHMITGNPEQLTPQQIHDNLSPVFNEMDEASRSEFKATYNLKNAQELIVEGFDLIKEAAEHKNIDQVLLSDAYYSTLSTEEREQLDDALMSIYSNGGSIIWSNKEDGQIKATLRFVMQTS